MNKNTDKLITIQMILDKHPCEEWTEKRIGKIIGEGKSYLKILSISAIPVKDRIWCISRFLDDITNRKFALWCARQIETTKKEITEYVDIIEKHYIYRTATEKEMDAANSAAHNAVYSVSDNSAHHVASNIAYYAANYAAYSAANLTAYCAVERDRQIEKLKELIKGEEKRNEKVNRKRS